MEFMINEVLELLPLIGLKFGDKFGTGEGWIAKTFGGNPNYQAELEEKRRLAEEEAPGSKRRHSIQNVIDIEEGTYKKTSPKDIAKAKIRRKKFRGKALPKEMQKGGKTKTTK